MSRLKRLILWTRHQLAKPVVRLAGRAVVAGVSVFCSKYADGGYSVRAALVAAVLVSAELFTPLNPLVGIFKLGLKPPQT